MTKRNLMRVRVVKVVADKFCMGVGGADSLVAGQFTVEGVCPLGLCNQRKVKIKERNFCDWEGEVE